MTEILIPMEYLTLLYLCSHIPKNGRMVDFMIWLRNISITWSWKNISEILQLYSTYLHKYAHKLFLDLQLKVIQQFCLPSCIFPPSKNNWKRRKYSLFFLLLRCFKKKRNFRKPNFRKSVDLNTGWYRMVPDGTVWYWMVAIW